LLQGVTDSSVVLLLSALLNTVCDTSCALFWKAVRQFADLDSFCEDLSLLTWALYFAPPSEDEYSVTVRVFTVMSVLVGLSNPTPVCPRCGATNEFVLDESKVSGRHYRCGRAGQLVSRPEARKRHLKTT